MQLELDNIQESVMPYGKYTGKPVKDIPAKYLQEIEDKAPNKRLFLEKLVLRFLKDEEDKYQLANKLVENTITLKVDGKEIDKSNICVGTMLNTLLSTHKA